MKLLMERKTICWLMCNGKEREVDKMRQVKFKDIENDVIHGGILTDDGDIICGCCGGLIPEDEIGEPDESGEKQAQILEVYDTWVDLDKVIIDD